MLSIDHITIAGRNLAALQQSFQEAGLRAVYGGPHASVTHMALLPFRVGSYLELISSLKSPEDEPLLASHPWGRQIAADGGPCAWAVRTDDIAVEAECLRSLGIEVQGPISGGRNRPDGVRLEWQTLIPGPYPTGAVLPFIIQDITPRIDRVEYQSHESADKGGVASADAGIKGVAVVVIGVPEIDPAVELFQRAYGLAEPMIEEHNEYLNARVAFFEGSPVAVASPISGGPSSPSRWLADRIAEFGPSPCAFLLHADNLAESAGRLSLNVRADWFGRESAWFEPNRLQGVRMGMIQ